MKKIWALLSLLLFALFFTNVNAAETLHITIVGKKADIRAKALYDTAVKYAPKNTAIQWWDGSKKEQPNTGVTYPILDKPAAYTCIKYKCSLPAFTPLQLRKLILHFTAPTQLTDQAQSEAPSDQGKMERVLKTKNWLVIMPLFWFFGLLLAVTPCVLPLMLIITSILGSNATTISKRKAFSLSLTYIIALASTYALAGMVVASFGFYLQAYMQNKWILGGFSLIFILLGMSLFGFFDIRLPSHWRKAVSSYSKTRASGSYIGVAIMGILATLIASPCVAAPLAGILAYVAESGDVKLGGVALFSTGIGIGTPILLIGTIGVGLLQKAGTWQKYIKQFFGILLLGIAIWMLGRIVPAKMIMFLWAGLAIFTAIYMGALQMQSAYPEGTHSNRAKLVSAFSKMLSLMLLVYGGALLVGGLIGNTNPLFPLEGAIGSQESTKKLVSFQHVKNLTELQQVLQMAQAQNKPTLLIFSAKWCTSCQEMERDVFPNATVQQLLQKFVLLYADLTNTDAEDIALSKHFSVIGPPALLFFNHTNITPIVRIDGAVDSEKLAATLLTVLKGNN